MWLGKIFCVLFDWLEIASRKTHALSDNLQNVCCINFGGAAVFCVVLVFKSKLLTK